MKRLRVILLFLLLGAIVNVAVAWGIALSVTSQNSIRGPSGTFFDDDETWELFRYETFGTYIFYSTHIKFEFSEEDSLELRQLSTSHPIENVKPYWGAMDVTTNRYQTLAESLDKQRVAECRIIDARGWPLRSFWCQRKHYVNIGIYTSNSELFEPKGLIAIPKLSSESIGPRGLPFFPIWTGVVVNMLFYTMILWLLFTGTLALHHMIRRKHGLCVKCAYDLRGAEHEACPECGNECLSS